MVTYYGQNGNNMTDEMVTSKELHRQNGNFSEWQYEAIYLENNFYSA